MLVAHIILTSMPIKVMGKTSRLPCVSTLVENGKNLILFDTGLFGQTDLLSALAKLGFSAGDITHIFNTHFHDDHAGGNELFKDTPKFANLKEFRFSLRWLIDFTEAKDKFRFMKDSFPYLDDSIIIDRRDSLIEHSKRVLKKWENTDDNNFRIPTEKNMRSNGYIWIDEGAKIPECISPIETPGHTKHHTSYVVKGKTTNLIIAGDALSRRTAASSVTILDEPHIDLKTHGESVKKLLSISGIIVPGHDRPFGNFTGSGPKVKVGRRMEF